MAVRVLGYIALLYQDIIRTQKLGSRDLLAPILPLVLYNGERRWKAPVELDQLIYPAPVGLERFRPQLCFLLLDQKRIEKSDLNSQRNLAAALFQLGNSQSDQDVRNVLYHLLDWFKGLPT